MGPFYKKKRSLLSGSRGMTSLAMVLVTAAITSIIALTASQFLIDLKSVFVSAEIDQSAVLSVQNIQRALSRSTDCLNSLTTAGPLNPGSGARTPLPTIFNTSVTDLCGALPCSITVGMVDPSNLYTVSDMYISDYDDPLTNPVRPAGCDVGRPTERCSEPVLNIALEKIGTGRGVPVITRMIPLDVRTDAANQVTYCFARLDREFVSTDKFVNQSGDTMTGELQINMTAAAVPPRGLWVRNAFVQTTEFFIDSDKNLKSNIHKIDNALAKVEQLEGKSFEWKSTGAKDYGFIAQEVETVMPELVHTSKETNLKSLKYTSIIPLTLEAIKELEKENNVLRQRLLELQNTVNEVEASCINTLVTPKGIK